MFLTVNTKDGRSKANTVWWNEIQGFKYRRSSAIFDSTLYGGRRERLADLNVIKTIIIKIFVY